jgi:hypothetical protein
VLLLALWSTGSSRSDEPTASAILAEAEQFLSKGDARSSASLLEDALPKLDSSNRGMGLKLLAQAYEFLRDEAKRRGDDRAAENYQRDLNLLNMRLTQSKPESGSADRSQSTTRERTGTDSKQAPSGSASVMESRRAGSIADRELPAPESVARGMNGADPDRPRPPAPVSSARDDATSRPSDQAASPRTTDDNVKRVVSDTAAGMRRIDLPNGTTNAAKLGDQSGVGAQGSMRITDQRPQSQKQIEPGAAISNQQAEWAASLDQGDLAFSSERYAEALRHYSVLAARGELPADRKEHWVYCRLRAVVEQINGRSAPDWVAIDRELRAIQALSPKNWFRAYLASVVRERSQGTGGSPQGTRVARPKMSDPPASRR